MSHWGETETCQPYSPTTEQKILELLVNYNIKLYDPLIVMPNFTIICKYGQFPGLDLKSSNIPLYSQDISPLQNRNKFPLYVPKNGKILTSYERYFRFKVNNLRPNQYFENFKISCQTNKISNQCKLFIKVQTSYTTPRYYNTINWQKDNGFTFVPKTVENPIYLNNTLSTLNNISDFLILVLEVSSIQSEMPENIQLVINYDDTTTLDLSNVDDELQLNLESTLIQYQNNIQEQYSISTTDSITSDTYQQLYDSIYRNLYSQFSTIIESIPQTDQNLNYTTLYNELYQQLYQQLPSGGDQIGDSVPQHTHSAEDISTGVVSNTEFDSLNNVSSNIQTQLGTKESTLLLTQKREIIIDTQQPEPEDGEDGSMWIVVDN